MKTETMADIVAMLRANASGERFDDFSFSSLADRIEAASERDEDRRRDEVLNLQRTIVKMQDAIARQADAVNAAALRTALEWVATFVEEGVDDEFSVDGQNLLTAAEKASAALAAAPEPPSDTAKMREAILAIKEINDKRPHDAAGYEINDIIEEALATAKESAKCVNGLRGEPDCRGCNEHCEDVRKRNCFYWNPDIEGGLCALTGKKSCPISCDNFHIPEKVSPPPAEGGKE